MLRIPMLRFIDSTDFVFFAFFALFACALAASVAIHLSASTREQSARFDAWLRERRGDFDELEPPPACP